MFLLQLLEGDTLQLAGRAEENFVANSDIGRQRAKGSF